MAKNQVISEPVSYEDLFLVGIGASAGGLEVMQHLFTNYTPMKNLSFVIVQHLSPDYKSQMAELLSKHTLMKVHQVVDGINIEANCIYVMPERKNISIKDGKLILTEKNPMLNVNFPIDIFLHSLGVEKKEKSIGVILSGTGTDGSRGIRTIKENGGIIMVQEPRTAKFSGMPVAAISTKLADFVLSPREITDELKNIGEKRSAITAKLDESNMSSAETLGLIIKAVHKNTGIDFSQYKRNTIYRRLERRMHLCKKDDLKSYYEYLKDTKEEVFELQKDLLIGVTKFFRDAIAFDYLAKEIIPNIFDQKDEDELIRIWTPGCSTGEEAYTIMILLEEFKEMTGRRNPIKLFATDIDTYALDVAGKARYPVNIAVDVEKQYLQKYFVHEENQYKVVAELRNQIVFARHNIFNDPPFNRVDLIVCRNMLIYLGQALQKKVYALFQFAINPNGYLFLGPSESLGEYSDQWVPLERKWKFFRYSNKEKKGILGVFSTPFQDSVSPVSLLSQPVLPVIAPSQNYELINVFKDILADIYSPMCAFINTQMDALYISGGINRYLNLPEREMRLNIMNMLPEPLVIPLSTAIQKITKENKAIRYNSISISTSENEPNLVDLKVEKVSHKRLRQMVFMVTIIPSTVKPLLLESSEEVVSVGEMAKERIRFLEQQLTDTQESLYLSIEAKETSNEELQASTEELQTSNEELMAANEELQSTNEELQSVNEELHALNSELQSKITELTDLSSDMDNFLNSTDIGTILLDSFLRLRKFTPSIVNHVQLIEKDIGRPIMHFNTLVGGENLAEMAKKARDQQVKIEKKFRDKNDVPYLLRIVPDKSPKTKNKGIVIAFIPLELETNWT